MRPAWEYRVVRWMNRGDALYEVMMVCFVNGEPTRAIEWAPGHQKSVGRLVVQIEAMLAAVNAADEEIQAVLNVEDIPDVPSRTAEWVR